MTSDLIPASVLVVGEALVDVVTRFDGRVDEAPGGSPANVALTLGRLGFVTQLLTRLGDDRRGRAVRSWLEESGVDVASVAAGRTATASARLNAEGAATYVFDLEWDLEGATGTGAGIVHTGSIAALVEPGATDVGRIVTQMRSSALVTYDPNIRAALMGDASVARRSVEELVGLSDLVKASDEDLRWLYPADDPRTVAMRWLTTGPAVVVVTAGADGAFAVTKSGLTAVKAERVEVIDTVGAGDTFMGALIAGVISGGYRDAHEREGLRRITSEEIAAMLRFAAAAAAITVSRPGADPPRRQELPAHLWIAERSATPHLR